MDKHKQTGIRLPTAVICAAFLLLSPFSFLPVLHAQTGPINGIPADSENLNSTGFKLTVCDGPPLSAANPLPPGFKGQYIACDFNGLMMQVQHLINLAIIVGVLVAVVGFCYMGYLLITGTEANRSKAKEIGPKIFWGFIIMLTAWFIVYQILSWLTGSSGFASLLK